MKHLFKHREKYIYYLRHESAKSIASSMISKNMHIENPIHTPNDPPRADMKVTKEYLAVSTTVFTFKDMKYTSNFK